MKHNDYKIEGELGAWTITHGNSQIDEIFSNYGDAKEMLDRIHDYISEYGDDGMDEDLEINWV